MPYLFEANYPTAVGARNGDVAAWRGTMFRALAPATVLALRVAKPVQTGTGTGHPTAIELWDWNLNAVLARADLTTTTWPTNSEAGWIEIPLDPPIPIDTDQRVLVMYKSPLNYGWAQQAGVPAMSVDPDAPWLQAIGPPSSTAAYSGFINTTGSALPSDLTWVTTVRDGADARVVLQSANTGDVDAALNSWLTNTIENDHVTDGLPWETNERTKDIDTTTTAVSDQQNEWAFGLGAAAHGYYDLIRGLLQTVKDNTDGLPGVIQDIVDVMVDHLDSEIATILATIDDVLSQLGAQSTDLSGTAGSAVGALSGRTGFPATGWSMSAETDFTDNVLFDQAADAYVLSITSYQDTQPANSTAAGLWLPRLGWWCPMNGSLASQRQFVDFEQMLLTDQGRRMPACAIELRPGTMAHVQAWLLA